MGVFDVFTSPERKIKSWQRKVTERYGPPENRQKATQQLIEMGTPGAIAALLMRFSIKAEPSITDEEEKQHVFDAIVDFGEKAIGPLKDFLRQRPVATSWCLRALAELVPQEELIGLCLETLKRLGPDYTRDPEKKIVVLGRLSELVDPRIAAGVAPFLEDPADEVKIAAAGVVAAQKDEATRTALLEALARPEQAKRVVAAIAEVLFKTGFGVQGFREKAEAVLPEPYFVDKAGGVKKRGA